MEQVYGLQYFFHIKNLFFVCQPDYLSAKYGVRERTKFVLIILGPINTSSSWGLRQRIAVLNRARVH